MAGRTKAERQAMMETCYDMYKRRVSFSDIAKAVGIKERTVRNYVSVSQIQEREKRKQKQKHGAIHYTSSGVMFR